MFFHVLVNCRECRGQCDSLAFIVADDRCPNDTINDWGYYDEADEYYYDAHSGLTIECISGSIPKGKL